ncbi:MAG: Gfo/Idh/MocA family oxidoreductase [Phycisphaerae bacterium]|nr:Gfo/Idh/MocA family oxidoreductase [Phycisphaerae bacterium]
MTRIAVIGLGRWGPNHIRNFHSLKGCAVVAAADPQEKARARVKALYPDVACVSECEEVLRRDDVDAVVVASPTATHFAVVKATLEAGKHVLCEKPLTNVSRDAWELVSLAESRGLILMVGHVFLFNPGIAYLSQAVREGVPGPVYYMNAVRTNLGPFRSDVNAAWDLASHDIYILNDLLGQRPRSVAATGASYLRPPVEDTVFLTLRYEKGVVGHIHVSWLDPRKVRQITVVGEKKMITWDEFGVPGPVMIYDRSVIRDPIYDTFGEFQLLAREGDVMVPRIPNKEPLAAQAQAFAEILAAGKKDFTRGSARQGAEVVDVLETAQRSLASGGAECEVSYGG